MNRAELVEEVANQTGLTKRTSREAVDAIISAITDSLGREEKVTLVGFWTFRVMERKTRRGRNPRTGEEVQIPTKKVPKFVPAKSLRKKVK
jgi:DNA-binding protein HU-beta